MRRLASVLVASALALPVCAVGAPAAHATILDFTGTLRLSFGVDVNGAPLFSDAVDGSGSADVSRAGADIDGIAGFPAGVFQFAGTPYPAHPDASPITAYRLNATSGEGGFGALETPAESGFMGLLGAITTELAGGIQEFSLRTDRIGLGGNWEFDVEPPFDTAQLRANGWTTGSVTIGSNTYSGFSTENSVRLISPFEYEVFYPQGFSSVSPGVATLDLVFVPEPGTTVLLASCMVLLGGRARAAHRRGSAKTRC